MAFFSSILNRILNNRYLIKLIRIFKYTVNILSWQFPNINKLLASRHKTNQDILAIWDFQVVPFTVGEFLLFQEAALTLRELYRSDKIDIVLLCDKDNPARKDGGLNAHNFHYYFSKLLPLAFVNPCLGSVLVMDSHKMLVNYIATNSERYHIFPPHVDANGKKIYDYTQLFNYVQAFYVEYGRIPYLSCKEAMVLWARQFLGDNTRPLLPVTVQLRNTSFARDRNAKMECWLELFAFCEKRYDVAFILIGEADEIDSRFRGLPNVIIAKNYATTVEQDLALLQTSLFFMGTASGPLIMAWFGKVPYVIYGMQIVHTKIDPGKNLLWATPLQKLVWEPETTDKLIEDFIWLYDHVNKEEWGKEFDQLKSEATNILIRRNNANGEILAGLSSKGVIGNPINVFN